MRRGVGMDGGGGGGGGGQWVLRSLVRHQGRVQLIIWMYLSSAILQLCKNEGRRLNHTFTFSYSFRTEWDKPSCQI